MREIIKWFLRPWRIWQIWRFTSIDREATKRAIKYARKNLDLSKNLNDQGYYGPLPNDADPRTIYNGSSNRTDVEYYGWIEYWIFQHNYIFDNEAMYKERIKYLDNMKPNKNVKSIWTGESYKEKGDNGAR